jgi:hypothetical protein
MCKTLDEAKTFKSDPCKIGIIDFEADTVAVIAESILDKFFKLNLSFTKDSTVTSATLGCVFLARTLRDVARAPKIKYVRDK